MAYQSNNCTFCRELSCVEESPNKFVDVFVFRNSFVVIIGNGIFGERMQLFVEYRQVASVVITTRYHGDDDAKKVLSIW